jgi:Phage Tail Collar Domain
MSYPIRKTDGSLVIDLAVGTTDFTRTSLALIGKNASDFGLNQNQNFVRLLENFAATDTPHNPLVGQLWFDINAQQLNVKTASGFTPIGPFAAPATPTLTDTSNSLATTAFVHGILPKGSIILWYGSVASIPTGWALCNGQSVNGLSTPDLCGVFVMGAGVSPGKSTIPGYSPKNPGDGGGKSSITVTPAHTHQFSTDQATLTHTHQVFGNVTIAPHKHAYPGDDQLAFANGVAGWAANSRAGFGYDARSVSGGGGQLWESTSNLDGAGTSGTLNVTSAEAHPVHSHTGTTNSTGTNSVDVTNPYYSLAYIMKVI